METAKQFSVPLVNKPGHFASVLSGLNKEKVAIRAFSVMDTGKRGTLRFVPDDATLAASALQSASIAFESSDVLLVEVSSHSGGLPRVCQRLALEHLNVDYAYGSLSPRGKGASLAVIKVNDLAKAQRVLADSANGARGRKLPGRRPAHAR